jgi:hypothetical protein
MTVSSQPASLGPRPDRTRPWIGMELHGIPQTRDSRQIPFVLKGTLNPIAVVLMGNLPDVSQPPKMSPLHDTSQNFEELQLRKPYMGVRHLAMLSKKAHLTGNPDCRYESLEMTPQPTDTKTQRDTQYWDWPSSRVRSPPIDLRKCAISWITTQYLGHLQPGKRAETTS